MNRSIKQLHEYASKIPTIDFKMDLEVLFGLISKDLIYMEFCLSRINLLFQKNDISKDLISFIGLEKNSDIYLPILNILINNLDPKPLSNLLFEVLLTDKMYNISYFIISHQEFPIFMKELCIYLYSFIPENFDLINIRNNLLFRYISLGGSYDFLLNCLYTIPITLSIQFYEELLLISSFLINNNYNNFEFINLMIDICLVYPNSNSLIEILISNPNIFLPKEFYNYIIYKYPNIQLNENKIKKLSISELSPFLRIQTIFPSINAMNVPTFCRYIKKSENLEKELITRINKETNPILLHDLLLSNPLIIPLSNDLPFKFIHFAYYVINNPNYSSYYLSEFVKINKNSNSDLILAAVKGLFEISKVNSSLLTNILPHIMYLISNCNREIQIYLLDSLKMAILSKRIDSEFIWRRYHSIRTITQEDLEFNKLAHFSAISLIDDDDKSIGSEILLSLSKINRPLIETVLLKIPPSIIQNFSKLLELRPTLYSEPNPKTDPIPNLIKKELEKELTTSRLLLISTCYGLFFDAFKDIKGWPLNIVLAGKSIFEFNIDQNLILSIKLILSQHEDRLLTFSALFSLAMLLSYQLISINDYLSILINLSKKGIYSTTRMLSLFCLSFHLIEDPMSLISFIIGNKDSKLEDYIGLSYCISSWFTNIINYVKNSNKLSKLPFIWSHFAELNEYIGNSYPINNEDYNGFCQYIYLTSKYELIEKISSNSLSSDLVQILLFGFIPNLVFNINDFIPNEKQYLLLENCKSEDFILIKELYQRPRLSHKIIINNQIGKVLPSIQKLKNEYHKFSNEELFMFLSSLSSNQHQELINNYNDDLSILVAYYIKDITLISKLLSNKRRPQNILNKISNFLKINISNIIIKMIEFNSNISNISYLLSYFEFDQIVDDHISIPLLPYLLFKFDVSDEVIIELQKTSINKLELAHCTLLKRPNFFQLNESNFSMFHKI